MTPRLTDHLHELYLDHLLHAAETTRDWPESGEQMDQATRQVREAMILHAIGKITQEEKSRLLSILAFARPEEDDPPANDSLPPIET
jgi:hypothetical protein